MQSIFIFPFLVCSPQHAACGWTKIFAGNIMWEVFAFKPLTLETHLQGWDFLRCIHLKIYLCSTTLTAQGNGCDSEAGRPKCGAWPRCHLQWWGLPGGVHYEGHFHYDKRCDIYDDFNDNDNFFNVDNIEVNLVVSVISNVQVVLLLWKQEWHLTNATIIIWQSVPTNQDVLVF